MRLPFLTYLIFSILLTSCTNNFKNHQPIDGKEMKVIPNEFLGKFKDDDENLKVNVESKTIILEEGKQFKDSKRVYFESNGVDYVIKGEKKHQIYDIRFFNDSVFGKIYETKEFELNQNLIAKKVSNYYVFNFEYVKGGWSPTFIEKDGYKIRMYLLNSDILQKYPTEDSEITEDFDKKDVEYFFKRKNEFLTLCYELNTNTRRVKIIKEPY